ncbi:MAG: hypothetical protein CK428_33225 [Mycobacterium sp.]|nr:MAG: hypothetical protein CK428_33225 [Mycobacterium sp.]
MRALSGAKASSLELELAVSGPWRGFRLGQARGANDPRCRWGQFHKLGHGGQVDPKEPLWVIWVVLDQHLLWKEPGPAQQQFNRFPQRSLEDS